MAQTIYLSVAGMHCASCVGRVERELQQVAGVDDVSVNLAEEQAMVETESADFNTKELISAVERAGYKAEIV